ncbi:NAD(P)/FAD-dependent oxidoreductase [Metallosphaera tengchongensis]|uniref:NAD(P)/FAD-dependent oxidoreductase n=1 Tax=Metallosphaera tengchongensis TaxID=1532350 RepID=A0A6N0NYX2_9CREN|nr:FAD/NAD(P)-binding oxidoreductase [Metallosphaera tengchongensis]QKR00351.1 NAD(P)/FAD-dependent oxidoreductase [Metallosphaera tengchongensis]
MVQKVVIVGGGNGGAVVANRLRSRELDVTVVDPSPYHLYQPGIVDYVFGVESEESIVKRVDQVISASLIQGKVTKVEVDNHTVFVGDRKLEYDYLVLAPGVRSKNPPDVPSWHTLEEGKKLKEQLSSFNGKRIVVGYWGVIKCPAAPFEFSFLLKERFKDAQVTLLNPVTNPPEIQRPMAERLGKRAKELGIEIKRGFKIRSVNTKEKEVESEDGEKVKYDLALLDAPVKVSEEFSGLVDQSGFIPVDKTTLRYRNYDNVFVVGDANNIIVPPKTGSKAHYEAKTVANNILAKVEGGEEKKYDGSAMCAVYSGFTKGLFITMNFERSRAYNESVAFNRMKRMFTHIYWTSLKGYIP